MACPARRLVAQQHRNAVPALGHVAQHWLDRAQATGSGSSNSPTSQPSTAQMTSSSSSLTVFGWPDHTPDIFPALITMPRAASGRCSSLAFQIPRLALGTAGYRMAVPMSPFLVTSEASSLSSISSAPSARSGSTR
jgi:hypothetical protein